MQISAFIGAVVTIFTGLFVTVPHTTVATQQLFMGGSIETVSAPLFRSAPQLYVLPDNLAVTKVTKTSPAPQPTVVPDHLTVTEHGGSKQLSPIHISDANEVEKLYSDTLSLPDAPDLGSGTISCLAIPSYPPIFDLTFYKNDSIVLQAEYDPYGCRGGTITLGNGESKSDLDYEADLEQVLGLTHADFLPGQSPDNS